jgi:serine/threonine protein kinase
MADIYLARVATEAGVQRHVVLKRVQAERASDVELAKMFLAEARLAAQLQHPNIAQVYDIGKLGGSYFFTMEYVHGEDVRRLMHTVVTEGKLLPINLALQIAAGALAGLHHAHDRLNDDGQPLGVVHRDVSPSNVMIGFEGTVKVLDFGVAKATGRDGETNSGTIKGKVAYLSPEQCQGKRVDRRSDIFGIGIVLHEMLTGERLYKRESDFEAMVAIVSEDAPAPSKSRPEISPAVDALVLKALAKKPEDRYINAEEMVEAIEALAAKEGHVLSSSGLARYMRGLFGQRTEPWNERTEQTRSVTVTGSFDGVDPVSAASQQSFDQPTIPFVPPDAEPESSDAARDFEAQLLAAQPLYSADSDSRPSLPPRAVPPPIPPIRPTQPGMAVHTPIPGAGPSPLAALSPSGPSTVSLVGITPLPIATPVPVAIVPARKKKKPRTGLLIAGLLAAGGVGVALAVVAAGGDDPETVTPVAVPAHDAPDIDAPAVAVEAPDAAMVAVAVDADVVDADVVDADVVAVVVDAAHVAAVVVDAAPDAFVQDHPPPKDLAGLIADGDFKAALAQCGSKASAVPDEHRVHCGVAACRQKQKSFARAMFEAVPKADRGPIEQACKATGVSLLPGKTPKQPTGGPDPCIANPLDCRR